MFKFCIRAFHPSIFFAPPKGKGARFLLLQAGSQISATSGSLPFN
jgi:hypothetical protein